MEIQKIYEDEHTLALNKPSSLLVHPVRGRPAKGTASAASGRLSSNGVYPDGKSEERTLSDWVEENYPELKGVGETQRLSDGTVIKRPGIVHRLDRETSGVILIAKTQESYEELKRQFKERKVKKTYRAFVYGLIKEERGIIDRKIGKSRKDFRLWSAQRGARGKLREAITEYKVLKRGEKHSYLELYPRTGRTHQIRVHLKAIHHPVVCDSLYAPNHPCELGFERLALHAFSIEFESLGGKRLSLSAPLPSEFKKAEKLL